MTKINSTIHILIICLGFLFLIVYIKSIDSARNKDFEYLLNYNRELAKEIHYLKNPIEADCKYKLNGIIGEDVTHNIKTIQSVKCLFGIFFVRHVNSRKPLNLLR